MNGATRLTTNQEGRYTLESVRKVSFDNPMKFLSQSGRFRIA